VRTDVRENASVDALAAATQAEFGGVDLLFNNAGVYLGGDMRTATEDDWRFVLDVNLDGVFRVGQTFMRILCEQGRGGHIVNTASVGGFISHGGGLAYAVSKYGVVAYSEAMRVELEPEGIGVSTLCPGPIDTNLPASDRLRATSEKASGLSEALSPFIRGGMKPDEVGPIVLSGIRRNLPYIFTHDDMRELFAQRFETILAGFDQIGDPPAE
jgi:NAD(P)-dependent dehydrogenase (short-subunit alcohol dehydrogenase family)